MFDSIWRLPDVGSFIAFDVDEGRMTLETRRSATFTPSSEKPEARETPDPEKRAYCKYVH